MSVGALSIFECHQCEVSQRLTLANSIAQQQCHEPYIYLYDAAIPEVWTYRNNEPCIKEVFEAQYFQPHLTPSATPTYLQSIAKQLNQLDAKTLKANVDVNLRDWQGEENHSLHHISEHYLADHPVEEHSFGEFLLEILPKQENDTAHNLYRFMQITSSITFNNHPILIEFNITFSDGSTAIYDINKVGSLPAKQLPQFSLRDP